MSRKVKFRKVPLELLIDTLTHLYNSGANYIDIVGIEGVDQDVVTISVEIDYMNEDYQEDYVPDSVEFINDKLSDEDINNLMNE